MRRETFTVKITNPTPETISFINDWYKIVPKIFVLDGCVVSAINQKRYKNSDQTELEKKVWETLNKHDLEHNRVSLLFLIWEKLTNTDTEQGKDSIIQGILDYDIKNLNEYMSKAKLIESKEYIENFIQQTVPDLIEQMKIPREILQYANDELKLYQNHPTDINSSKERLLSVTKLINKAKGLDYPANSIEILLCIARIYGYKNAQLVLKFKENIRKFNISNSLGDALALPRLNAFCNHIQNSMRFTPTFLTFDQALHAVVQDFKFTDYQKNHDQKYVHRIDIQTKNLMPCIFDENNNPLNKDEAVEVYSLLGIERPFP
jgi:hypothetical protein